MSEKLCVNEDRARRFEELHIHTQTDYETYAREMIEQWHEDAEDETEGGKPIKPMWLRRNGEDCSEFAAHIDYLMPMRDGLRCLAAIDVSSEGGHPEVEVWMPKEDGSGEPVIVTVEPYTLSSLGRAIEFVESSVTAK